MSHPALIYLQKQREEEERRRREQQSGGVHPALQYLQQRQQEESQQQSGPAPEEDRKSILGTAEDFARGVGAGFVKTPAMVGDLAMGIPDLAVRGINKLAGTDLPNPAKAIRDYWAQGFQAADKIFDQRGAAGTVGEFVGGLPAGSLGYGTAAAKTGQVIVKYAPKTKLAEAIVASTAPTASLGKQVAANVATGLPINVVQAVTRQDASGDTMAKDLAFGVGFDAAFPVLGKVARPLWNAVRGKEDLQKTLGAPTDPNTPPKPGDEQSPERRAQNEAQIERARQIEAARKAKALEFEKAEAAVAEGYRAENPDKSWKAIPKKERNEQVKTFMKEHKELFPLHFPKTAERIIAGGDPTAPEPPKPKTLDEQVKTWQEKKLYAEWERRGEQLDTEYSKLGIDDEGEAPDSYKQLLKEYQTVRNEILARGIINEDGHLIRPLTDAPGKGKPAKLSYEERVTKWSETTLAIQHTLQLSRVDQLKGTGKTDTPEFSDAVKRVELIEAEIDRRAAVQKTIDNPPRTTVRHGTDVDSAVGIIQNGLRKGSSLDVGSGLADDYMVVFEFEENPGSQPYYRMDGSDPGSHTSTAETKKIKAVYYDGDQYVNREDAEEGLQRLREALDAAGLKDMPIQGSRYDEKTDRRIFGGPVKITNKTFAENLPTELETSLERKRSDLVDAAFALDEQGVAETDPRLKKLLDKIDLITDELVKRGVYDAEGNKLREPNKKRPKQAASSESVAPEVRAAEPPKPDAYQNSDKGIAESEVKSPTTDVAPPEQSGPKRYSDLNTMSTARDAESRRINISTLWKRFQDGHLTATPGGKRNDAVLEVAAAARDAGRPITLEDFVRISDQVTQIHRAKVRQQVSAEEYQTQLAAVVAGAYSSPSTPTTPSPNAPPTDPRTIPASAPASSAPPARPVTSREFSTLNLSRSVAELLRLPPEEVKAEFKRAKIKYDPRESVLDNLKEHVNSLLDANPRNAGAILDQQRLAKMTVTLRKGENISPQPIANTDNPVAVGEAVIARTEPESVDKAPQQEPYTPAQFAKLMGKDETKLTDDEAIALYNKMDETISGLDMLSAQPYRAKQDRLLEEMARRGISPTASDVRVEGIGGGFDNSMKRKLGAVLYNKGVETTSVKELVQNAIDSIRGKPGGTGKIKVVISDTDNSIEVTDDGLGVTPEVLQKEFVDVGGTDKPTLDASGGFGVAKVGYFSAAEQIEVHTTAWGKDGKLYSSTLRGSGEDWDNFGMVLDYEEINPELAPFLETGTTTRIKFLPEAVKDIAPARWWLNDWLERSIMPGISIETPGTGLVVPYGERSKRLLDTIRTPGAIVEIWGTADEVARDYSHYVNILNNGNYQFNTDFDVTGNVPRAMLINIKPTVDVKHIEYPFTLSRDEVRGETKEAIKNYFKNLGFNAQRKEVENFKASLVSGYANIVPTGDGRVVGVFNTSNLPEVDKLASRVANERWTIALADMSAKLYDAISSMYLGRKVTTFRVQQPGAFGGIDVGSSALGMNVHYTTVADAAKAAGVSGLPIQQNIVLYNPMASRAEFGTDAELLADQWWGTLVHEFAHQHTRKHNEDFSGALTRILGVVGREYTNNIESMKQFWEYMLRDSEFNQAYQEWTNAGNKDISKLWKKFASDQSSSSGAGVGSGNAAQPNTPASVGGGSGGQAAGSSGGGSVPPSSPSSNATGPRGPEPQRTRGASGPFGTYIRAGLNGGMSGLVTGVLVTDEDDPNRWAKVAMWTAAGAGMGLTYYNVWVKNKLKSEDYTRTIPNTDDLPKVIYSVDELPGRRRPTSEWLRMMYRGLVRSSYGLERSLAVTSTKDNNLKDLPAIQNAGKLASMFGRWISMTESWLTHRPVFVDPDGNAIELKDDQGNPLKPLQRILTETARGMKRDLDELLVARTTVELAGRHKTPMEMEHAIRVIYNAPEYLHKAADEFRQYHLGLLTVLRATGRISEEGFQQMRGESWYAPLERVLTGGEDQLLQQRRDNVQGSPKGIYNRKEGGGYAVLSPYEKSMQMTARILKAAEYAQVVSAAWRASRVQPEIGDLWMKRGENRTNPGLAKMQERVRDLAAQLKISQKDAAGLLSYMDDTLTTLDVEQGSARRYLVTGYEDGELRTYQVNAEVFDTFKSMHPYEVDGLLKMLSIPARAGSSGVVHNPMFIFMQGFIDTFHAALTSAHGFFPGKDSLRGWWNIMQATKPVQDLYALGGPSTIQGLRYTGGIKEVAEAVKTTRNTPWQTAVAQFKEMHPLQAIKTMMLPIAEAARVGEYLRALDHGATTLEGVYAAWNVMGNVKAQGSFGMMRAFNLMTMFSRPAISAVDQTVYAAGLPHPRRGGQFDPKLAANFVIKGFAAITLPSMILWWVNKDDQEINDVRRTEAGQRYWFFRNWNGEIMKMRKPQVIGPLFGSLTENILDKMYAEDPQGTNNAFSGMMDDIMFNMLPQFGVLPITLTTGKVAGLGSDLVPVRDEKLEPKLWGQDKASLPARLVADKIGEPITRLVDTKYGKVPAALERLLSPAAFDLTVRTVGGMLGEDALKVVTYAVDWKAEGMLPPKHEAPLVGRLFNNDLSGNTGPIRMFYEVADKVERKAVTVAHFAEHDATKLPAYITDNMPYLMLTDSYKKARLSIAKNWRAINDIRAMPDDIISPSQKRALEAVYLNAITMEARVTNTVAKSILSSR